MDIRFEENGLHFWLNVDEQRHCRLFGMGRKRSAPPAMPHWFTAVQLQLAGQGVDSHHGRKHTGCMPGMALEFVDLKTSRNEDGLKIELIQKWKDITVTGIYQLYDGIPVARCWTEVEGGHAQDVLEYVTSFSLCGILPLKPLPRDPGARVSIAHNTWYGEGQWHTYSLLDQGYYPVKDRDGFESPDTGSMKRICLSGSGTWGTSEHLSMGALTDREGKSGYVWQIETSGAWHWEISDSGGEMYLQLSGPSFQEHGWRHPLKENERFCSVPCAIAYTDEGGVEAGIQALTRYRRRLLRDHQVDTNPLVIFNDYMNCLWGDPTTEKVLPLVRKAAQIGCGCYCVDAGWYADGPWWDEVGQWEPSKVRFPNGIEEVIAAIHRAGMKAGLWLEPEVIGIKSPLAGALPEHCFFHRDGRRVIDNGRYQLDFSQPDTIRFIDGVIDRIVGRYGAEYIKIDYNIHVFGTDDNALSAADGLLRHTRAYLAWLTSVRKRYPGILLENCSSGGMRTEYSLLSRQHIQSVSDQTDYRKMAYIACNAPAAVLPEQAAVWSYPMKDADPEAVCFNMVNAMLLRVHQSGHLVEMAKENLDLIRQGIALHLSIAPSLRQGVPFWPLGFAQFGNELLCLGIRCGGASYIAVWAPMDEAEGAIELDHAARAALIYPTSLPRAWRMENNVLRVRMQGGTASVFQIQNE